MTLGEEIKKYRAEHGMTMDEFALKSGLSKSYISRLEKNTNTRGSGITPTISAIDKVAKAMNVPFDILFRRLNPDQSILVSESSVRRIPVLGRVAAGIPIEAIENITDWEEIPSSFKNPEDFFALEIHGDSMEPRIYDGDVVVVRKQVDAESDEIVIASVNGHDATCKRLMKYQDSIGLISLNSKYPPMMFSSKDIQDKPVQIWGKVVEIRGKLKGL